MTNRISSVNFSWARWCVLEILMCTLASCSSFSHDPHMSKANTIAPLHNQQTMNEGTLAELENREVMINSADLRTSSVEEALQSYHAATSSMPEGQEKIDTLKRMADLTTHATEVRDELSSSKKHSISASDSKANPDKLINQQIDTMLYRQFMQGMATAKSRQEAAAYLDMASSVASKIDHSLIHVDFDQAIALYQQVLASSHNPRERQETYYKLARVYDMAGRTKDSIATLQSLAKEYPDSPFYVEAEFRSGEMYFEHKDYADAIESYQYVLKSTHSERYRHQATYKLGWCYYKLSDYPHAVATFFDFYQQLIQQNNENQFPDARENDQQLLHDTARVISLSLMQENGVSSLDHWFVEHGDTPWEADMYKALAHEYLLQDRFQDAASAFNAYVERHPMDAKAPEFSADAIMAYQNGGFPGMVLPAKVSFVQRYGEGSSWWEQADDSKRQKLLPYLRSQLLDLAKHEHAIAQHDHASEHYVNAAHWYKEYLATHPSQDNEIAIRELLAEALHFGGQNREAIDQFHQLAYGYGGANTQSEKAAAFELACYESLMAEHSNPDVEQDYIKAALNFARHFPADKRAPSVLADIIDNQLANHHPQAAIATAQILVGLEPPAPAPITLNAWKVIADNQYDLGQLVEAEVSYNRVLGYNSPLLSSADRTTYENRLAATIYKEAVQLRDQHSINPAVQTFLRVGETVPHSDLGPAAQFDAANLLLSTEQYGRAIPVLESFRQLYPHHELMHNLPAKLGLAYEKTGNYAAAAQQYVAIANDAHLSNPELARESMLHAANLFNKTHLPDRAADLYRQYVQQYPHPANDLSEAENHLLDYYTGLDDQDQVNHWLQALVDTDAQAGLERTDRTRYLAAMASFRLAQPDFDAFKAIQLSQPLADTLAAKKSAMRKVLNDYNRILAYDAGEYSAAATYQIATTYHLLAQALLKSDRPAGLSGLELEQYNILLEEQADPFDDKAIHLLVGNTELVKQGLYDSWIRLSFAELAELSPGRYDRHEQLESVVPAVF